ncbi:MAG: hypothetical protein ACE5FN_02960 [Leptospirillia bacterium]
MNPNVRKVLFSSRALLTVTLCAAVMGYAAYAVNRSGLAWDGSGVGLGEARAVAAELAPGSRVILVTPSPLERLLIPLSRDEPRLDLVITAPDPLGKLRAGDVQVQSGDAWLVLHKPDLTALLAAVAAVSSPDAPAAVRAAPMALPSPEILAGADMDSRQTAMRWVATGLLLPLLLAVGGVGWRVRRRGR